MEKRKRRVCKTPGYRYCNVCEGEFPISTDYFVKDSSRPGGCGYECKACHSARRKGRDRSKELSSNLPPIALIKRRSRAQRYAQQEHIKNRVKLEYDVGEGRSKALVKSYKTRDRKVGHDNDITAEWFRNNIEGKSCVYCGDDKEIGCDRLDNSKGHLMSNVVPACRTCNVIRGNRLTYEEMLIVGKTVTEVKNARNQG